MKFDHTSSDKPLNAQQNVPHADTKCLRFRAQTVFTARDGIFKR
jgi:hypothetical protein